jgi:hypothetical protein
MSLPQVLSAMASARHYEAEVSAAVIKTEELTKSSKEPFRAYITGTTDTSGKGKLSLIVETTHRNHPKYLEILEHIKEKLEKDHLTKVEAVELRQQCYDTW